VLFGSDAQVSTASRRTSGCADQVLFAGTVAEGTSSWRVADLLGLTNG
jgi:hypothetical protein